jgi:hypothetical protein
LDVLQIISMPFVIFVCSINGSPECKDSAGHLGDNPFNAQDGKITCIETKQAYSHLNGQKGTPIYGAIRL